MRKMMVACVVAATVAAATWAAGAADVKSDPAAPVAAPVGSAAPAGGAVKMVDQVSQYGITWTFDKAYPVGQYVTGDFWVVGPVTVKNVDPAPTAGRNGSAVNPKAGTGQPYDDRTPCYDGKLQAAFPLQLGPGQSLVSVASQDKIGARTADIVPGDAPLCPLRTAVVLTCVDQPQAAEAFRPAYVGDKKATWTTKQLRRDLLPRLALPAGAKLPDRQSAERILQRIWLDHLAEHMNREMHPRENMPGYGRELTTTISTVGLMLLVDDPKGENEQVLLHFVQLGIDYWGVVQSDNDLWRANGGHNSGRKWPILFAGLMLGDEGMQQVKAAFAEDQQTYYGQGYRGQTALWRINPSLQHEELPPAEWKGPKFKGENNGQKSESYRDVNGPTWVGQALAARLMGAKKLWDHEAYFDYVDRWVKEGSEGSASDQTKPSAGYKAFSSGFFRAMWETYRPKADQIGEETAKKRGGATGGAEKKAEPAGTDPPAAK